MLRAGLRIPSRIFYRRRRFDCRLRYRLQNPAPAARSAPYLASQRGSESRRLACTSPDSHRSKMAVACRLAPRQTKIPAQSSSSSRATPKSSVADAFIGICELVDEVREDHSAAVRLSE